VDFGFTSEEIAFREEVRRWLNRELPPPVMEALEREGDAGSFGWCPEFSRKLAARGWLALSWPPEYGGLGRSQTEQLILNEELAYHGAPVGAHRRAVSYVAPAIMGYGSEEQKRTYLPLIARAEAFFCFGFSEPQAGSDLASLQTRAVADGDDYVISGQKLWVSDGHLSTHCWLAARTDPEAPRHRGITMFIVDMRTPGITARHLPNILGKHGVTEVFFDEVRVPRGNIVGGVNQGWQVVTASLNFERCRIEFSAAARRTLEELAGYVTEKAVGGRWAGNYQAVRQRLAEMAVEIEVGRLLSYRVAWMQAQGRLPSHEASIEKVYGSEMTQRLAGLGMQVLGLGGQLGPESKWAPLRGKVERLYLSSLGTTIYSGTSEIQRNTIALRGLGLPH
jgi:alkylation response protein AidB-like acyl-CoA dehydrogenase